VVTPAARFITLCAREPASEGAAALRAAAARVSEAGNWPGAAGEAARHGVAELVRQATRLHDLPVPAETQAALEQSAL
jgi:hypothetical protein